MKILVPITFLFLSLYVNGQTNATGKPLTNEEKKVLKATVWTQIF